MNTINITKNERYWLKNEFSDNEFCSIKRFKEKGIIFYPEIIKSKLGKDDILIGEYWFDGNGWCFSLFSEYEYLSI